MRSVTRLCGNESLIIGNGTVCDLKNSFILTSKDIETECQQKHCVEPIHYFFKNRSS